MRSRIVSLIVDGNKYCGFCTEDGVRHSLYELECYLYDLGGEVTYAGIKFRHFRFMPLIDVQGNILRDGLSWVKVPAHARVFAINPLGKACPLDDKSLVATGADFLSVNIPWSKLAVESCYFMDAYSEALFMGYSVVKGYLQIDRASSPLLYFMENYVLYHACISLCLSDSSELLSVVLPRVVSDCVVSIKNCPNLKHIRLPVGTSSVQISGCDRLVIEQCVLSEGWQRPYAVPSGCSYKEFVL